MNSKLKSLLDAIEEFRCHAMYPSNVYGNHASGFVDLCSTEKKMKYINANDALQKIIDEIESEEALK